jgi:hypothetical protein
MARRDRYTLGHLYQPTTPRRAYGRRAQSCMLIEHLPLSMGVCLANDPMALSTPYAPGGARRIAVPMPHGGVRWLLECPRCGQHVNRLYYRPDLRDDPAFKQWRSGLCHTCWGFRYRSQYQGRRPEAARERVEALCQTARASRDPETCRRRLQRADAVETLRIERAMRHDARKSQAFTLALLPALLRCNARIRRTWLQVARAALRQPEDRRARTAREFALSSARYSAKGDTLSATCAAWAATTLLATLGDAHSLAIPAPAEPQEPLAVPGEPGGLIITREHLDELRAQYDALKQPRQRRKAA